MKEEGSTWKATHTIVWDCMPCRPSFSEDGLALWGVTPDRVLQKLLISTGEVVHGVHVPMPSSFNTVTYMHPFGTMQEM